MDNFRPPDFWKESIMTLPDGSFFELVRTVFGKIKTPFSKQALIGDLEKFLLRADIQKNVAGYLDARDGRVIAATAFLGEPSAQDLEDFFAGDIEAAELGELLVNLEERFIVYRFRDESRGFSSIALNPLFEPILRPLVAADHLLFPSIPAADVSCDSGDFTAIPPPPGGGGLLYDERIPAVLLSFASMDAEFFRSRGSGIRRKVLNRAETILPGFPLETLVAAMQVLGLFAGGEEELSADHARLAAFARLSRQERAEYFAAALFCRNDVHGEGALPPWVLRGKLRFCASFIHRLYLRLDPARLYPQATVNKFAYIIGRDGGEFRRDGLVEIMLETGLLVTAGDRLLRARPAQPASGGGRAVVAMDTPFSMMVSPEISYGDAVKLAAFSHVAEAGLNVRFEINRESAVAAFNLGVDADTIVVLLQRLSAGRLDENLIYALKDWEKSYREVTLHRGLVLVLSPERRYLAETRPLSTLITETLAPGVYLLPETLEDRVLRSLDKAGVSIVARRNEGGRFPVSEAPSIGLFPPLRTGFTGGKEGDAGITANTAGGLPGDRKTPDELTGRFQAMLKGMRFEREKHDELAARIERRLILCESQLKDAVLRYEKLEARGMDYPGKNLIAKQAIALQCPVEVTWTAKQKRERITGIPAALEKTGSEAVLVVAAGEGTDAVRIPLGKISLLRRIKKSIFETATG